MNQKDFAYYDWVWMFLFQRKIMNNIKRSASPQPYLGKRESSDATLNEHLMGICHHKCWSWRLFLDDISRASTDAKIPLWSSNRHRLCMQQLGVISTDIASDWLKYKMWDGKREEREERGGEGREERMVPYCWRNSKSFVVQEDWRWNNWRTSGGITFSSGISALVSQLLGVKSGSVPTSLKKTQLEQYISFNEGFHQERVSNKSWTKSLWHPAIQRRNLASLWM